MCSSGVFKTVLQKVAQLLCLAWYIDIVNNISGENSDRVQQFKRWFWSVVEKMNNIERQDLVSTISKALSCSA